MGKKVERRQSKRTGLTGPGDFSTEGSESLDENSSLDGPVLGSNMSIISNLLLSSRQIGRAGRWERMQNSHVEASDDAGALERLALAVLGSEVHETWCNE